MSLISKSARLPYDIVKGSVQNRNEASIYMAKKIVNNLQPNLLRGDISLAQFRRLIISNFPKNLFLKVDKNKDKSAKALVATLTSKKGKACGFEFDINLNTGKKLGICDLPVISHEVRHISDFLYHPKFLARDQFLHKKGLDDKKYEKFYGSVLYTYTRVSPKYEKEMLNIIKDKVNKFISKHSVEDKIDYLQAMRYSLIMENNAYTTQYKVAKYLYNKKFNINEGDLYRENKNFMFDKKIELLKQMMADIIKKERIKHKIKIKIKSFFSPLYNML